MPEDDRPRVLISVPNGDGWIHKHVAFALMRMQQDPRVKPNIILPTHSPYVNNLHKIVKDFLDGEFDYWISMDNDNPPRNNVLDLVFLEKPLIGCPTPVWHNSVPGDYPIYWNAYDWVEEKEAYKPHEPKEGLQEVDAIGTGCFVVSNQLMQCLFDQQPFMRQWNDDGTVEVGNDLSFCQKVKKAGFPIYAHYDYPCYHFNEIEIGEINVAFQSINTEE